MKVTSDELFRLLALASCGAYALATDQTIVFWNRRASEILGYTPAAMIGRRCVGAGAEDDDAALTGDCARGCLMMSRTRAGLIPDRGRLRLRSAGGEWKWLLVTPMVVSGLEEGGPLLVYLFGDVGEKPSAGDLNDLIALGAAAVLEAPLVAPASPAEDNEAGLTKREREALSYLARGWPTQRIADEMSISPHTARNHIENVRRKLGAANRLESVLVAMRRGIIPSE